MSTGAILINGVNLPYHVIDKAIEWAKDNQSSLRALFIFKSSKNAEDYGFPSDIERAETLISENEADAELERLVIHNMRFTEKQVKLHGIQIKTEYLKDPSLDEVRSSLSGTGILFIDPDNFKHPEDLANVDISYDDLVQLFPFSIVQVPKE
jgi:hypothetical protein